MVTLVAGTGYLGRRVLDRLDDGIGLNRPAVDFDTVESLPLPLPERYAVLYTVPPGGAGDRPVSSTSARRASMATAMGQS